ncbi:MAG TPA: hypothetical protein PKW90_11765, partial [Myxococcota bacterium]|nr:hypothetical protein [Myxococcota bacterium]
MNHSPITRALHMVPPLTLLLSIAACQPTTPDAPTPKAETEPKAAEKGKSSPVGAIRDNRSWWPEQVDLSPLRRNQAGNPYGESYDYAAEFAKLDLAAVKADIAKA